MTLFVLGGKEVKRASGLIKHYSLEIRSNVFISTIDSKIRGLSDPYIWGLKLTTKSLKI